LIFKANWFKIIYNFVHYWLGKWRLIKFIMTITTISNQINNKILFESFSIIFILPIIISNLENSNHCLRIICIHMNNWGADSLGNISAVKTCSRLIWTCCESNLIINNHMNTSSNWIRFQILHLKRFIYNTLTCKGTISM